MFEKMECRSIDRLLWDYAAMTLCEPDMEKVEAHIGRCRTCAKKSEAYASVVGVVKTGRLVRMPESGATWHDLRATLEMERRDLPIIRSRRNIPVLAFGSLAIAGLLILVVMPKRLAIEEQPLTRPTGGGLEGQRIASDGGPKSPAIKGDYNPSEKLGSIEVVKPPITQSPIKPRHRNIEHQNQQLANGDLYGRSLEPRPSIQNASYRPGDDADRPFDSRQQKDYVLTPVRMGGSQGDGAHFVMGTIPQSEGGITTASYTKAVEEPPVW